MSKQRKILLIILGTIGAVCLIAAGILLVRQGAADKRSQELFAEMREQAENRTNSSEEALGEISGEVPVTEPSSAENGNDPPIPEASLVEIPVVLTDNPYQDSFLANTDMAAWLKIEGTKIDYPVMWTPRDENYYLYRNFEGKDDNNGCLILDTDSSLDPLTTNLIIHGHNMRSGAMFGTLTDYEKQDFAKEHNIITLYTKECERRYEVIAVFRSQVYRKTDQVFKFYKFFQADTQEEFDDFYQNIKALSLYDTGVTAEFGDSFITLSTCVYHVEQGRFVVVAKEIETGDWYSTFSETNNTNND